MYSFAEEETHFGEGEIRSAEVGIHFAEEKVHSADKEMVNKTGKRTGEAEDEGDNSDLRVLKISAFLFVVMLILIL